MRPLGSRSGKKNVATQARSSAQNNARATLKLSMVLRCSARDRPTTGFQLQQIYSPDTLKGDSYRVLVGPTLVRVLVLVLMLVLVLVLVPVLVLVLVLVLVQH